MAEPCADGKYQCDTCGTPQNGTPVVGWHFVYIGNDESYSFCSRECKEKHWVGNDVDLEQQRLHNFRYVEADTDRQEADQR